MTTKEKKDKIKFLVAEMLEESYLNLVKKIDKAINSGAVDVESWSDTDKPMILPKCIVAAILQDESTQYEGKGTSYEKEIKKDVKNIRYYL